MSLLDVRGANWTGAVRRMKHSGAHPVLSSITPHPEFRLWLTTAPHPTFPNILLQQSLKINGTADEAAALEAFASVLD